MRHILKDRGRRPDKGEWEPIKISQENSAYIPKLTKRVSLLTRPRHLAIKNLSTLETGLENLKTQRKTTSRWSKVTCETTMTKIKLQSNSRSHRHFIKHLMDVSEKLPQECNNVMKTQAFWTDGSRTLPVTAKSSTEKHEHAQNEFTTNGEQEQLRLEQQPKSTRRKLWLVAVAAEADRRARKEN
jgi:hypothetical protein